MSNSDSLEGFEIIRSGALLLLSPLATPAHSVLVYNDVSNRYAPGREHRLCKID